MKKAIFYNFLHTKAEEEAAKTNPSQPLHHRTLIEIRDIFPPSLLEPNDPWLIKKVLKFEEIQSSKLILSYNETFNHIFRYWSMEMVNCVLMGKRYYVTIWDVSDNNVPNNNSGRIQRYESNGFLEEEVNNIINGDCFYYLVWKDLAVQDRRFNPGDEIGLFWDAKFAAFHFKLLRQKA